MLPPVDLVASRHARLRSVLAGLGLDRLLVTNLPNIAWLTGFTGSSAAAVVDPDSVRLIVDARYSEEADALAATLAPLVGVVPVGRTYDETIADALAPSAAPVGFEAAHLTVGRHLWFEAALRGSGWQGHLKPTSDAVESCRIVKDDWEVSLLREGAARLSAVTLGVLADLTPGIPESVVAQQVEAGLRRAGFSRAAFDTIVASGPRAALPHGRASDRVIAAGELVVLDLGGVYGGYCVDLTRTVALGSPGPEAESWFLAVAEAQAAAIEAVAPGRTPHEIDAAARRVLESRGLGERFSHGTGHGLGLEVHEAPRIGPHRAAPGRTPDAGFAPMPDVLVRGMVFTIEPGVYLPGSGGVRIEDDVLVTASGVEVLTSVPRTLVIG